MKIGILLLAFALAVAAAIPCASQYKVHHDRRLKGGLAQPPTWGKVDFYQSYQLESTIFCRDQENVSIDWGIVTVSGPTREVFRFWRDLSRVCGQIDALFLLFASIYCLWFRSKDIGENPLSKLDATILAGCIALLVASLWCYHSMTYVVDTIMEARQKGPTVDVCLREQPWSPSSSSNHHWFSHWECFCAWHKAATKELNNQNDNIDMQWFHASSMYRASMIEKIVSPVSPVYADQIKVLHRELQDTTRFLREERRSLEQNIHKLQAAISDASWLTMTALQQTANVSFVTAWTASKVITDHVMSGSQEKIVKLEKHMRSLDQRIRTIEHTQQVPIVRRFWQRMHTDDRFRYFNLC